MMFGHAILISLFWGMEGGVNGLYCVKVFVMGMCVVGIGFVLNNQDRSLTTLFMIRRTIQTT